MLFMCSMVRLSLKLATTAQDQLVKLAVALRPLLTEASLQPGCSICWIAADLFQPNILHYIEQWSAEADLLVDLSSGRYQRLAEVMEAAAEPPVFTVERVERIGGLDYVEAALKGRS